MSMPNNRGLNGKLLRFDPAGVIRSTEQSPNDIFMILTLDTWSIKCNQSNNNACGTTTDPYYFVGDKYSAVQASDDSLDGTQVVDSIVFKSTGMLVTRIPNSTRVKATPNGQEINIIPWSDDIAVLGQLDRVGNQKMPWLKCNTDNCALIRKNGQDYYTILGDHRIALD